MIGPFTGEYCWLSNFYPVEVALDGVTYPSVEHAFQAAKTLDAAVREKIREAATASAARRMRRSVKLRSDWEQIRVKIMLQLVWQKFQHPELRARLLATTNEELVEINTWGDRFWGVCGGEGENVLGRILMAVRSELRRAS